MMSAFSFLLKKWLGLILTPPVFPLLLIGLGLAFKRRGLAYVGFITAVALSMPPIVAWLLGPLQIFSPPNIAQLKDTQAIVILGGGRNLLAPEYGGTTINRMSLERLRYGARLARETGLPVLLTGGAVGGGTPEAELMRDAMEHDFGVPVRWVEADSRDTAENARFSAALLQQAKIKRVTLVTHAVHMNRAAEEFALTGLDVLPAPTGFYGVSSEGMPLMRWLPNANAAYFGWLAAHEWLGHLALALRPWK